MKASWQLSKMVEKFADLDGIKLHYIDWGGSGQPLLLLPGLGPNAHIYRGLGPRLAEGYRVLAMTRRGHGRSSKPGSGYDLQTLTNDILHFMDHMQLQQPVLIGHSFAGIEMPLLARRHPERVRALIFLDAVFPKLDPEPDLSGDPVWDKPIPDPTAEDLSSVDNFLAYYKRTWPSIARHWCAAAEANRLEDVTIRDDGSVQDHHDDELMNRILAEAWDDDPRYDLVEMPMLTVVPHGAGHPGLPQDASDELRAAADRYWAKKHGPWIKQRTAVFQAQAPHSRVVALDTANHYLFLAREDETLEVLLTFLREI